eukprot:CAMPEP_0173380758 /NCGR_PEP_ID=MMETSP1356-20130122/3380_1 /TAXON_ID=77927 ORGANISM="Hemiselmis virescens, Strain PCC157" /NCGR_SAMPLE_ID=MMETSP1356 /ASSEMBLY_ACC=CAM_ASM_000847 /LENGTH=901 /DNA_ID=CAMNT_0014334461 /DNA_START=169 /DNA_END=2874 /DNA_ORIENTATION=-
MTPSTRTTGNHRPAAEGSGRSSTTMRAAFRCPSVLLALALAAAAGIADGAAPPGRTISSPKLNAVRGGQPGGGALRKSPSSMGIGTTAYTVAPKTNVDGVTRSDSPMRGSRALSHPPNSKLPVGPAASSETAFLSSRLGGNNMPAYIAPPTADNSVSQPPLSEAPGLVAKNFGLESLAHRVEALNLRKGTERVDRPIDSIPAAEFTMPTPEQVLEQAVAAQAAREKAEREYAAKSTLHEHALALQAAKAQELMDNKIKEQAQRDAMTLKSLPDEAAAKAQEIQDNITKDKLGEDTALPADPAPATVATGSTDLPAGAETRQIGHELFMQTMMDKSELTDCSFELEDGTRVPSHRCILVTKSAILRETLANPSAAPDGVIRVPSTSVGSLRAFMQFLYVGDVSSVAMSAASWQEIWNLAVRYEVAGLKTWLAANIDSDTAAKAAEMGADAQEHGLLEACFSYAADSLPQMPEESLKGVRACVALNLMVGHPAPVERFKFAQLWCHANDKHCGDEDVLTLLKGVDLDRLTMSELMEFVRPSNLLTSDMLLDLYEQRLKTDSWGDSSFDIVQTLRLYPGDHNDARHPVPSGVALFGDGRVVVCDSANAKVQMLSFDGRFIREYGPGAEFGHNHLVQPWSVAVGVRGQVIVVDRATNSIQVFTETGFFLRSWGEMGDAEGQFRGPHSVAVHPMTGDIIVTDEFNHRVQVFDVRGRLKRVWGGEGDGNGEFRNPTGVAVSWDGNVIVADCGNARVQIFSAEGHFIRSFGSRGEGPARFRSINGICVAKNGDIVVCDPYSDSRRLQVFDSTGVYLQSIGSYEPDQTGGLHGSSGEVEASPAPHTVDVGRPRMIAIDQKGTIYVTDMNENKISVLAFPDGTMATRENRGGSPGATPVGVTGGKEAAGK